MLPKDFLTYWAAKQSAEAAINNWDIVSQLCERDPARRHRLPGVGTPAAPRRQRATSGPRLTICSSAWRGATRSASGTSTRTSSRTCTYFKQFLDEVQPEFLHLEAGLVDEHLYAGSFDAIARIDGEVVVLDWKTSKAVYDSVALQLAAYRYANRIILAENGESVDVPLMAWRGCPARPAGGLAVRSRGVRGRTSSRPSWRCARSSTGSVTARRRSSRPADRQGRRGRHGHAEAGGMSERGAGPLEWRTVGGYTTRSVRRPDEGAAGARLLRRPWLWRNPEGICVYDAQTRSAFNG
ncbi:hypothetical protein SMICM304S_08777 [Streptomyces microflavus]